MRLFEEDLHNLLFCNDIVLAKREESVKMSSTKIYPAPKGGKVPQYFRSVYHQPHFVTQLLIHSSKINTKTIVYNGVQNWESRNNEKCMKPIFEKKSPLPPFEPQKGQIG